MIEAIVWQQSILGLQQYIEPSVQESSFFLFNQLDVDCGPPQDISIT